ncbi:MAG: response regulator [Deltaproteobacteria bacterium]|nr:response regulator [Deltaproteobacteria bacterium]
MSDDDLSLLALFRAEVESHAAVLSDGLARLDAGSEAAAIEPLMRAAHSIKGAARVVDLDAAVRLAHAMEDALVGAQHGRLRLSPADVDVLLRGLDWIVALSTQSEDDLPIWMVAHGEAAEELEQQLAAVGSGATSPTAPPSDTGPHPGPPPLRAGGNAPASSFDNDAVRITADTLSRLMGLAAESLVQARRLEPLGAALQQLKTRQHALADLLDGLRDSLAGSAPRERAPRLTADALHALDDCRQLLAARIAEVDRFALDSATLSARLYDQVIASRLRPFGDATPGLARVVRDVARQLGKQARLEIGGLGTAVDREILAALDAPLNHLLRNAVDHGIEAPELRAAAGKPAEGRISLDAMHQDGLLLVRVRDDGAGIDAESVRRRIVARGLADAELAAGLSPEELFSFILLPGFSTRDDVSQISGRGVGLDAVQTMVQAAGGTLQIASPPGGGTEFSLRLPVTRSVLRTVVATIGGEPYAVPLARTGRIVAVAPALLRHDDGRASLRVDDDHVPLLAAADVLELDGAPPAESGLALVIGEAAERVALEVEALLGEHDLVVHPLDARLGKVPDVAAAATLPDGTPVLVLDVDDLVRSAAALRQGGRVRARRETAQHRVRRVLVVEDSLTVREMERRVLERAGYAVDLAIDGMEGWNALRRGDYDLVLTDIDMPRLTGLELVRRLRADPRLRALPVVIVSYKDRDEDRQRGLAAGADRYLTKSSFQDDTLAAVVRELLETPR